MRYLPYVSFINDLKESASIMSGLGCDPVGISLMKDKSLFYVLRLKNLTPPQANIIKQDLLSCGGEAACAKGVIINSVKFSDVLMFATLSQYKKLAKKIKANKFSLPEIGSSIEASLKNFEAPAPKIKIKGKLLDFTKKTYLMGILNVTPDSFSDGGQFFDPDKAIAHARNMIKAGADIIDIGGESTRPGSMPISAKEEIKRILPVVKALSKGRNCLISIDTTKSEVAEAALKAGANIINDISALRSDKKMAKTIARHKAVAILMHMQGTPRTMQENPTYNDLFYDILCYLKESIEIAVKAGILSDRIIVDPGFGFGKNLGHNLALLKGLRSFKVLGRPILVGTSRKKMIGKILGLPHDKRLLGTAATVSVAILNGANIIRVHDVHEMKQVAKVADAILGRSVK